MEKAKTKKCYKLMRKRKDGTFGSLFINRKEKIQIGKWLTAKGYKTDGFHYRPGWHCLAKPKAPHLSEKDRVWCLIEIKDFSSIERPASHGKKWFLAKKMRIIKELSCLSTT